ncbi:MAG: hypothetical protein O7H41_02455 [Planctomycetota bacterium]|nr:hypothetical protein [Planctomycetota bacterium]
MRGALLAAALLSGCAAQPLTKALALQDPMPIRVQFHPSVPELEAQDILLACAILYVYVGEVTDWEDNPSDLDPSAVAVLDRGPGRLNLRLYSLTGDLIFEDTARVSDSYEGLPQRFEEPLGEIARNLALSDRVRSYARHGSPFPPDVLLGRRQDAVYERGKTPE